jgi:hypothetical protein
MKHQLQSLIRAWSLATGLSILIFGVIFFGDNHPFKGDISFMLRVMMAIVWISIPGIVVYAAACLGLAMLRVRPGWQLFIRLLAAWIYLFPFVSLAAEYLRLQSIGMAAFVGVGVAVIWHWKQTKHGFTLVTPTPQS